MKNIDAFCETRAISVNMREAFIAYVRSDYAQKYWVRNGETMRLVVSKLSMEEVEEAWQSFVNDFKNYLSKQ